MTVTEQPQLVVGDDGSTMSDLVWLWVNNHQWPGWRIAVATAQDPASLPPGTPAPEDADPAPHTWQPDVPRELFRPAEGTAVEYLTAATNPRDMFEQLGGEASLIAIGTRGTGALKLLHIGSTADWLINGKGPKTPLIVLRSGRPTRHVVLAVDGSPQAQHAAEVLATMPWIGQCKVSLLGLNDGVATPKLGMVQAAEVLAPTGAQLEPLESAAIRGVLAMDPKSVIIDLSDTLQPDLIVMGTRDQTGLKRLLVGSTASAVAHNAKCSVMIVRGGDDAEAADS